MRRAIDVLCLFLILLFPFSIVAAFVNLQRGGGILRSRPVMGFAPWEIELVVFDIIPAAVALAYLAVRWNQQNAKSLSKVTELVTTLAWILFGILAVSRLIRLL
jgi:hypothetical protein